MNRFVNDISTKFVGKTTKNVRVRQVGGTRVSCMFILSPLGITKFWTKLAEPVLRRINLGHAGVTSVEMRPQKGSRTGLNSRKKSPRYVLLHLNTGIPFQCPCTYGTLAKMFSVTFLRVFLNNHFPTNIWILQIFILF